MVLLAECYDFFWSKHIMIGLIWGSLRNVVILTVFAAEVAACAGKGEARGARMEVIEWFLLDGIDSQRTGFAIDLAHEDATVITTAAADARLAIGDATVVRTKQTFNGTAFQTLIISTLHQNTIAS